MPNKKRIKETIDRWFKVSAEHRAAYELWLKGIKSEELTYDLDISDSIRIKVLNELTRIEKR